MPNILQELSLSCILQTGEKMVVRLSKSVNVVILQATKTGRRTCNPLHISHLSVEPLAAVEAEVG